MHTHILTRASRAAVAATTVYTLFDEKSLTVASIGLSETASVLHTFVSVFNHFDNMLLLFVAFPVALPLYIDIATAGEKRDEYIILFSCLFVYHVLKCFML